ncbi:MAG: V-type ATP synthase subunit A [Actinomycetota bacterium]|nr:V-type ATP synthase subunit A [Actinomycetota bacterium]
MTTGGDIGRVVRVAGPVVVAEGLPRARVYNVVRVGRRGLVGEVIRLKEGEAVIQVYEETAGLQVGSAVVDTNRPLSVELGPGLIGSVFDGVQRPLPKLAEGADGPYTEPFVRRGIEIPGLDRTRMWKVRHRVDLGEEVGPGDTLATVQETAGIEHRILVPPDSRGVVTGLGATEITVEDPVAWIDDEPVRALSRWPVRRRRPVLRRLDPVAPLITGQRVCDMLFPVARGGSTTLPGGFGTGKTVLEQTIARYADADVIVFIGCGERGNELAEVLEEFPKLVDPRTGAPLIERTVIIANTSNMPVAAREASIYTGITIAEYYRDQGYDIVVLADSTSRWGEALREVSSRLEELPGEEGFPAYLPSRLAEFYERAGAAVALGQEEREGSVTIIGAVSPPGGDFSEPVTQYSLRLAGTFWALDPDLARRRHYPAIHWTRSYSLYDTDEWFDENVADDWSEQRRWALELLGRAEELAGIVALLGVDTLAPEERVTFVVAQMLREDFLQQSAYDEVDAFCPLSKQNWMLRVIKRFHDTAMGRVIDGAPVETVTGASVVADIGRMRLWPNDEVETKAMDALDRIDVEVAS